MTRLREQFETTLPIESAFAYVADFANAAEWDPGVATAERLDDGPVGLGARYRLGIRVGSRVVPMEYRITAFEPPSRVVLTGSGSGIDAVDEIRLGRTATGTVVDYVAAIRLGGPLRLIQPLFGGAFDRVATNAANGMRSTLDRLAARDGAQPS
jgi:carbon monoxide dehydrogenase subunit G